ncbi:MAG: DUF1836 domain-containing protein [Oscillospiraceae bacterium]|nr:DUF1836 domain-containing protein [Oscillospiraceae bacterium]MBQ5312910.1 DUF1836 domain-containing protein [Oscillospiraceae bacterium]MBQ5324150.1 DUF1836 domain-containing protein [Oscillospiraceae bacterium]
MTNKFQDFHMPRYDEIPDIDLYMDQLLVYIDKVLAPLSVNEQEKALTTSMVNNYVKQGILPATVKKRYSRDHVVILIEICLAKQLYSIGEIGKLIAVQNANFDMRTSYNYICTELENVLKTTFSNEPLSKDSGNSNKMERLLVRNTVIAFAHKLHTQMLSDELLKKISDN